MKLALLSLLLFAGDLAEAGNLRDKRGNASSRRAATQPSCGCDGCTDEVLNRMAGGYSCGDRINWVQSNMNLSEKDACKRVAGQEFMGTCGPCDPNRCGLAPTPAPVPSPLTFENVWDKYTVQVKEDQSKLWFSKSGASRTGNDVTLTFQRRNGRWEGSEVYVVLPGEKYTYGNYKFHVKSVNVMDPRSRTSISNVLPKDMVLGFSTGGDTEHDDVHNIFNHEVYINVSRWGMHNNNSRDVRFFMKPLGFQRSFFSGPNQSFSQSNQWYSFERLPGKISWESTSGGGQTFEVTTEAAIRSGRKDHIQCLPAEMEVRMNLWNVRGANLAPDGVSDGQYIEVVIDNFQYEPATVSYVEPEGYCSKHCQCEGSCVQGKCSGSKPPLNPAPTPVPPPTSIGPSTCGCSGCTDDVFNTNAGGYSCGDRINWLQRNMHLSEVDACKVVAGKEFPRECGKCDPTKCT